MLWLPLTPGERLAPVRLLHDYWRGGFASFGGKWLPTVALHGGGAVWGGWANLHAGLTPSSLPQLWGRVPPGCCLAPRISASPPFPVMWKGPRKPLRTGAPSPSSSSLGHTPSSPCTQSGLVRSPNPCRLMTLSQLVLMTCFVNPACRPLSLFICMQHEIPLHPKYLTIFPVPRQI